MDGSMNMYCFVSVSESRVMDSNEGEKGRDSFLYILFQEKGNK